MTYAARQVLSDCRIALELLEEERNLDRWRVHWAGAVALTRAVGHVLNKVDGARNPAVKRAANNAFKRWNSDTPEHEIFRGFIDNSRNSILKEYRFNHHPSDEVDVAVTYTLKHPETGELRQAVQVYPIGDNIYRPILEGYREGDDTRDVLGEALDWWQTELDKIDAVVNAKASK